MKTTVKKWGLVISLLGVVTLAACGNKEESTSSSKGAEKVEQAIAISLPAELVTLDTTQTIDKNTFTIAQHLFEGLYRLDDKSVPVPGLAEDVEISEDGLTYSFKLRENAKWSNGDPITADDFVFAWKRLVDPASGAPNAYLLDNVKNSKEIRLGEKAVDEIGISAPTKDEFKVELINPQASFLTLISIAWLAPQQEAYVTEQGDDYASDGDHLLASGPFTITDWELGSDTWTLNPNPEYYDKDQVKLQEIKGTTVKEENTGINLFSAGDLDLTRISGAYVAENANDDAFVSHSDISNFFLDFNKKEGTPLANVNLRKAIAYAIDKEPLTASTLNDGAKPLNGLVPENLFVNQKTQTDFRKYSGDYATFDQEKAKKFWKEAQKEVGDQVELTFLVSDDDNGKKVSEYIQSQIEETLEGVKINITPQPKNNVTQSRREKDYELSFSAWNAGDNNLGMFFILYETDSAYNYGSYSNPDYDKLAVAAKTTNANDVDKQFADYKAAEKILLEEDAAQVPLYQSASNYLINPKIKDVAYPTYGNYFGLRNAYVE